MLWGHFKNKNRVLVEDNIKPISFYELIDIIFIVAIKDLLCLENCLHLGQIFLVFK
jgi:hypothetical protein